MAGRDFGLLGDGEGLDSQRHKDDQADKEVLKTDTESFAIRHSFSSAGFPANISP
jgi:hypothetical protein